MTIFDNLPFGIQLGITTNEEIENRGKCVKKIPISPSGFRCEVYKVEPGDFFVYSSENRIVSKVKFSGVLPEELRNEPPFPMNSVRLPQIWTDKGLRLYKRPTLGTSEAEALRIIQNENVNNIQQIPVMRIIHSITFNVNNMYYDFRFGRDNYNLRLFEINVTEYF